MRSIVFFKLVEKKSYEYFDDYCVVVIHECQRGKRILLLANTFV